MTHIAQIKQLKSIEKTIIIIKKKPYNLVKNKLHK